MSWSIPIARVAGILVRIHVTFILLIVWLAWMWYVQGGTTVAATRVLFILLLFVCVLLHEFGHAIAAKSFGVQTSDITLLPIGGVARLQRMPDRPVEELIVALAGPAVNVAIAFALFLVLGFRGSISLEALTEGGLLTQLMVINVWLVLFNMIPAFPMDGGRVLRALLATKLPYVRATNIAATIGQGCAFIFGFLGLLYNPLLIFIALFVYIGASQEVTLAQLKCVSQGLPVSSAMVREFRTLPITATLDDAVDALLATHQQDFPVLDDTGRLAGLLVRDDLIRALRKADPNLRVGDVIRRDVPVVGMGFSFEDALRMMQASGVPAVPVLDGMKRLVGLLTSENVAELMMISSARARRPA